MTTTRELLLLHAARYPQSSIRDYMKLLFQSAFGCEHLIADASAAAAYIEREAQTALPHSGDAIEPLDGPYCRVHLDVMRGGLSSGTFAALFARSAEQREGAAALLEEKLAVLTSLIGSGEIPLDADEAQAALEAWRADGFPAIHHSEQYRAAYAPAYRLLRKDLADYLPVFSAVDRQLAASERPVIVAIDGDCGSGKTTLAALLHDVYGCPVFHMDDYFLRPEQRTPERYAEPGGNVDRERFREEVLTALLAGRDVVYRPFDCGTMSLRSPVTVPCGPLTVIEGSYSLHPALRDAYTLTVFLTLSGEKQLERIRQRNGEAAVDMFAGRWIPLEKAYQAAFRPEHSCDVHLTF